MNGKKDAEAPALWRSQTVAKKRSAGNGEGASAEAGPAAGPDASPPPATAATATANSTTAQPATPAIESSKDGGAATNVGEGAEGAEAKPRKPMLISRKADFNVAEMMRQLREGEVEPAVQSKVRSTVVVKREKKPRTAPTTTAAVMAVVGDALRRSPARPVTGTHAIVVVSTTGEDSSAGAPAAAAEPASDERPRPSDAARRTAGHVSTPPEGGEAPAEEPRTPPGQPLSRAEAAGGGKGQPSPVKQGSVKKRSKKAAQAAEAPAAPAKTPAPVVTTVKSKVSLEELRARRSAATAAVGTGAAATDPQVAILEEISNLLLRYCAGGGGGAADGKLSAASWPTLEGASASAPAEAPGTTATTTTAGAAEPEMAASPEVELYHRLTALCQDEHVTSATLELLHELVKHTRVIPLRPQPLGGGAVAGGDGPAWVTREGGEHDAQAEDVSRRRLYAQQIILVLINEMRQRKQMEEQRRQLRELQRQRQATATGSALSPFSAPFIPASAQPPGQPSPPWQRVTTFAPQVVPAPVAGPHIPSLAAGSTAITYTHQPYGAGRSDSAPQSAAAPTTATATAPRAGTATAEDADMQRFLGAVRDRLMHSAMEPTVAISAAEREVLRGIQQSFKQQQQQQQQIDQRQAPVADTSAPGSSKTVSLHFDAAKAVPSASTAASGHTGTGTEDSGSSGGRSMGNGNGNVRAAGLTGALPQPTVNRTIFRYRTLLSEPAGGPAVEAGTPQSTHGLAPTPASTAAPTAFNCDAKPFVPAPVGAPMNAAAPAFVPGRRPAPAVAPPPPPQQPQQPQQRWASPEMFLQWKQSMEAYYRSLTYEDFKAATALQL